MNDSARERLQFIRGQYGEFIRTSAGHHEHRPEVVAGIMMRETEGGLSKWLDKPGPEGRGDGGHGHGLMQIDDRSFPDFCRAERWQDPATNIDFGCRVLLGKSSFLKAHFPQLAPDTLERAAVAAYNCGEGNVKKALEAGQDVDAFTTGHDYSRCVLDFAQAYLELEEPPAPATAPEPEPVQAAGVGIWGTLFAWLFKVFVKKPSPP